MKTKLSLLLAAIVMLAIFSCHKNNDDSGSSLNVKIIGTWNEQVLYAYYYKNGKLIQRDTTINEAGDYTKITFKSDKTVTAQSSTDGEVENSSGSYSLAGNKLTLIGIDPEDQSKDTTIVQCKINGSQMTWTQEATISSTAGEVDKFGVEIHLTKE